MVEKKSEKASQRDDFSLEQATLFHLPASEKAKPARAPRSKKTDAAQPEADNLTLISLPEPVLKSAAKTSSAKNPTEKTSSDKALDESSLTAAKSAKTALKPKKTSRPRSSVQKDQEAKTQPAKKPRSATPSSLLAASGFDMSEVPNLLTARKKGIQAYVKNNRVYGVANVLCDETGRLGALSYVVPESLPVRLGDAVHVPFGKRQLNGVVLGVGDLDRATREIISVYGKRATEAEIRLASSLADKHFSDLVQVAVRLAPRTGRGHEALQAGEVVLKDVPKVSFSKVEESVNRRFLVRAPLTEPADIASLEALRLSKKEGGQVLVLCPTVELVDAVCRRFSSGAARIDTKMEKGAWRGFAEGGVKVAIGTRTAALYSAHDLQGIIVVEEDHPAHWEATQPYTNARDIAAARTQLLKVPLVLIGSNPSAMGLGAKVKAVPVGLRSEWPKMRLIDRSDFPPDSRLVPPPLAAAISRFAKTESLPIVLSQSRKATRRCTRCGLERPCAQCVSSVCRHQESTPCVRCDTLNVRMVGWDAKRLSQLLGKEVEAMPLSILGEYAQEQSELPLQDRLDRLVVVFDIDSFLSSPGLFQESVASHVIMTAARSAGKNGQVIVLTSDPSQALLQDLCQRKDQLAVAKRIWQTAKELKLPPFGRLVTVRSGQSIAPKVSAWPGTVYGPKKSGSEWEVLVKLTDNELTVLKPHLERLRRGGKVRITVA